MLYLIPCLLSGANLKVCNLSPFICCFGDQIRKGPSPLMFFLVIAEQHGIKVLVNDIIKDVAIALRNVPEANGDS
jgi:hypothetical protein